MPRDTRFRLLIVGGTLLLCAVVIGSRGPLRDLAYGGSSRDAGPPSSRAAAPGRPTSEPPRTEPAEIRSMVLDEAAVNELLPHLATATWVRYDPITVVRVVPDQSVTLKWREHAAGTLTLRTNNMGFREDEPTLPDKHGDRVLVLGDSHTFGLVENQESFANLLEARLGSNPSASSCEVINAGASGTGPYESRALLGLLLPELRPDLVVFVLYTGNDFINTQAFADFEARRPRNPMPRDAQQRFAAARERERGRMAQNTSQVHSFKHRTGDADVALTATTRCVLEMAQYCSEFDARLLVALLPAKEDVDLSDIGHMQSVRDELLLCDEDFAINGRLAARFAQALRDLDVPVVDLAPALAGKAEPLFWRTDHHLNVAGHAAVAQALFEPLRNLFGRR